MNGGVIYLIAIAVSLILGMTAGYFIARSGQSGADEVDESVQPAPAAPQYPSDALHIWRDPQSKQIVIRLGERVYRTAGEMSERERKVMQGLLAYLQRWLGVAAVERPQQVRAASPAPPARPSTAAPPSPPRDEPAPAVLSSKSIVAQIDDILQEMLETSPLKSRGIRLMESPRGGMTIWVGLESYQAIDDVPDAEIVTLIRAAVEKWEALQ